MAMSIHGEKIMYDCSLCGRPFQYGPHIYNGRHIAAWDVQLCDICLRSNWDGIVPERAPRLLSHLKQRNIPIQLNASGWLDIP